MMKCWEILTEIGLELVTTFWYQRTPLMGRLSLISKDIDSRDIVCIALLADMIYCLVVGFANTRLG